MSGESIKRKTLGEDHHIKSVSSAHRHKSGPLQQAQSFSSSLLLPLTPPFSSHQALLSPRRPPPGTGDLKAWHTSCLACCYTPIAWSSQAECTNPKALTCAHCTSKGASFSALLLWPHMHLQVMLIGALTVYRSKVLYTLMWVFLYSDKFNNSTAVPQQHTGPGWKLMSSSFVFQE